MFANLKNRHRFTKKIPSDNQLKKQFESFLSKVTTSSETKKIIENIPKKYKWRLLCKHEEIISGKVTKFITKTPLQNLMERLQEEPSIYSYNNLFE